MSALVAIVDDVKPSRLPPHDIEGETHLLASVIELERHLAAVADRLLPRHFYDRRNRLIFEAVVALMQAGHGVDYLAVGGWLRDAGRLQEAGGVERLNDLAFQSTIGHVDDLADRVINLARSRELIATAQRIAAAGYVVTADGAQGYIEDAERQLFRLAQQDERGDVVPMQVVATEAYHRMLAAEARKGQVELPTGLTKLDEKIGGLGRGKVTAFAGRTSMGKTAIAMGIAENLASLGETVLIFSLEMPRWQLAMRMACSRASASTYFALHGWLQDEERSLVLQAQTEMKLLPIWIDETSSATLAQIRTKSRLVAAKTHGKLGAIVIDYLQLMRAPRARNVSRDEQLSEITAGLKALAKEMDCAVVPISQLNREADKRPDKRPVLSDLRESGGIEQDADDVIFIYRPEYYLKGKTPQKDKGVAELIIAKQRNGPPGKVRVAFEGRSTSFFDLAVQSADNDDEDDND